MALPNRLRVARMTDATIGNAIDDHVGALEQAVCDMFGLDIDVDIAKAILGAVDSEGRITAPLRLYSADSNVAGGVLTGLRIRDDNGAGADGECLITVEAGYIRIYSNTGTEAAPTWTSRATIDLATGLVSGQTLVGLTDTPAALGTGHQALAMDGAGGLVFTGLVGCKTQSGTAVAQTIPSGVATPVQFNSGDTYDTHDFHSPSTNPENVVIPADGVYHVDAELLWDISGSGSRSIYLTVGGAAKWHSSIENTPSATQYERSTLSGDIQCSQGDVVQLLAWQTSGSDLLCGWGILSIHLVR